MDSRSPDETRTLRVPDGYWDLPPGKLVSVVTYLEMTSPRVTPPPVRAVADLEIHRVAGPDPGWYRNLFRRVGEEWLWFSRLRMTDDELAAEIQRADVDIFTIRSGGRDVGLIELDRREPLDIELAMFGLTSEFTGMGAGRYTIDFAIREAFRHQPRRFHLHTCTLDHPRALTFYVKAGFRPYKRGIEISDDPRLTGEIAREVAAGVPIL